MRSLIIFFVIICALKKVKAGACNETIKEINTLTDDGNGGPLSDICMRCICEEVGCSRSTECGGNACGPFAITYEYWQTTFKKDENLIPEYLSCVMNAWCAARTVQEHSRLFLQNCLRISVPGRPVCETALALHHLGAKRCNQDLPADRKDRLFRCLDRQTWNWLSKDLKR